MSQNKKNILIYSFSGLLLVSLMVMAGVKNPNRKVKNIEVDIQTNQNVLFTSEPEVLDLMTVDNGDFIMGLELDEIDPKVLERRVEANPFVSNAEVYRDIKGNLMVRVDQTKPIARIRLGGQQDKYIDERGFILPINARQTARVPLIEFDFQLPWEGNLNESPYGMQLFDLLRYIEQDAFWKAQIAHLVVAPDGDVSMYPQVTKQVIEFGAPDQFDQKFDKLMTFYKEILPVKGWNTYNRVNLKFENQIIYE